MILAVILEKFISFIGFKELAKGPLYGKFTTRYHRSRDYVSPNQSCEVFRDFGQKKLTNFKTRLWPCDTCHMSSEGLVVGLDQ